MSREAWGDPPEREPQRCPVCDGEWHAEGCELGAEVSRRLDAELGREFLGFGGANAVNVGQRDFDALSRRKVHACDTGQLALLNVRLFRGKGSENSFEMLARRQRSRSAKRRSEALGPSRKSPL